ncbi:hypothetical protein LTSEMON_4241 [Salmonella enterica subsp. enterica serovar Montevideo str. S5-403]|uniref:Chlorhexidine efflux transporter domain-containing protein n=1 Tax=Salmonella enterica subsp. enterica serovar Montevideo str. S5-403 TaxID=913242 RepID=G5Q7E3_SALMO|nr:hypothetical protein LTSEMON_4241 [Salmonella enterica subsp. enterica serovar Montevideo str. S5-403]
MKVRALHALGFESGFIVIGVSIVAWVLNVSLLQAFTLEIGFLLFFLPYTMLYNWAYDVLRQRIVTLPALLLPGSQRSRPSSSTTSICLKRPQLTLFMVNCASFCVFYS